MRNPSKALLVAAATLSIALAGCSGNNKGGTGSNSSPAPGTSGSSANAGSGASSSANPQNQPGTAASCLVGSWKGTGQSGKVSNGGVEAELKGGSGVSMAIAANGGTTVTFDGM